MDAQLADTYSRLVAMGQISMETMWDALIRGELLPDSFDHDMERERLLNPADVERFAALATGRSNGS